LFVHLDVLLFLFLRLRIVRVVVVVVLTRALFGLECFRVGGGGNLLRLFWEDLKLWMKRKGKERTRQEREGFGLDQARLNARLSRQDVVGLVRTYLELLASLGRTAIAQKASETSC
jgi:hypothetical protein